MEKKRDWKKSKYIALIRITKENLNWIKENKKKYTMAGFLNKIINSYKNKNKERG